MVIIAASSNLILAKNLGKILSTEVLIANTKKFSDNELKVQINADLSNKEALIVQSISNPANDHLMELLFLADIAKNSGAKRIVALIPYFGYSRQDKEYSAVNLVTKLIGSVGIDEIITIDLHSKQFNFFNEIENLDPSDLFVPFVKNRKDTIIVSPDLGSLPRATNLAAKLGLEVAIINKIRNKNGKCKMLEVTGNVKDKHCVIVDDIVDTGETICKASEILTKKSLKSFSCFVTHGVFSGNCLNKIEKLKFDNFYVTDTIYHKKLPKFIKVVQSKSLISKVFL